MAPMPSIKTISSSNNINNNNNNATKPNTNYLYVSNNNNNNNDDIDIDTSSNISSQPSSTDPGKSQCSSLSDGESFEGYGENELGGIHLAHSTMDHVDHSHMSVGENHSGDTSGVELDLAPSNNKATGDEISMEQ